MKPKKNAGKTHRGVENRKAQSPPPADSPFRLRGSEQTGGCRPAEIPRVIEGEQLVVKIADLERIEK